MPGSPRTRRPNRNIPGRGDAGAQRLAGARDGEYYRLPWPVPFYSLGLGVRRAGMRSRVEC